jgi:putative hydrolase of the HAD superfamily
MTHLYKAIFFDLDGTLRIPTPSPTDAFILFARSLNVQIDPISERHVKLWAHQYWGQHQLVQNDMERFDTDGFWINYSRLLLENVKAKHNINQQAKLVREWFDDGYDPAVTIAPGSIKILSWLKEQGYKLGVISNRSQPFHDVLAQLQISEFFDYTLAAGEIGIWKPNPLIFSHSIAQFENLLPEECVYIGDNYFADALGAKEAGLFPVLFDPDDIYEQPGLKRIQHMEDLLPILQYYH